MKRYWGWLRLAERLGKTLREVLSSVSYREYQIWMEYFQEELNTPSRSDYYLMQICREIYTRDMKRCDANKISPEDFRLTFNEQKEKKKRQEGALSKQEYEDQIARSMVMHRMGMNFEGKPLKKHNKRSCVDDTH